jgi:succinoglycan biosynthesis transport protein ExoP
LNTSLPSREPVFDSMEQPADQEQMLDIRELLEALNRHKWGILSVTLITVLLVGLYAFAVHPIYRATVTLLIENRSNQPLRQVQDVYDPGYGANEYLGTQAEIIKSRDLARKVVKKLNLLQYSEFKIEDSEENPLARLAWRKWLPFLPSNVADHRSAAEIDAERLEFAVDIIGKKTEIEPVSGTNLVKIFYSSKSNKQAALIANTLADVFIESNLDARLSITQKTSSWLTDRVASAKVDLSKAEQALQAFREKENLVDVGGSRGFVEQALTDNAQRLRDARKKKTELASAYQVIKQAGNDPAQLETVSSILDNKVVQDAKSRLLEASQKVKSLESRYGPKHPQMEAAKANLLAAQSAYNAQLVAAAQGVKAAYEIASETERQLSSQEQGAVSQIRNLDRKQYQLGLLERDVNSAKDLYNLVLTRFKETESVGGYQEVVARVIDAAAPPEKPFKPEKIKLLLIALVCGLLLGMLTAALRHLLGDTIDTSEDLEAVARVPVLSVLPEFEKNSATDNSLLLLKDPKSGFSEGIRSLRTGLLLADLSKKRRQVVITSSVPKEGKSTISLNLALSFAQIERVLVIDGDLRRPSLAKLAGLPTGTRGLTEFLSGSAKLEECVHHLQEGNIDILPVGQIPPNPAEIIVSQRFQDLISTLSQRYDRIFFDSAPCQAVSDTLLLVQNADAVLLVVRAETTARTLLKYTVRQLNQAKAPLVGTLINAIDVRRHAKQYHSYYGSYRYYA